MKIRKMKLKKKNFRQALLKLIPTIIMALILLFQSLYIPITPMYADTVSDEGTANEYDGIGLKIVERALKAVGQGYSLTDRYGPTYYDCSGLIYTTLKEVGYELYGTTDMTGVPTYTGAWNTLINSKNVGDEMTFNGLKYKLVAKNTTVYSSHYFEKPGTIMIFDGHAGISLGTYDYQGTWYDTVDYVAKYLIEKYGDTVTDLKTELVRDAKNGFYGQDCIFINGNWQTNYNKVWKVDALSTTWGVAVNNGHTGKSADSTTVLGVWEPVEPKPVVGTAKFTKTGESLGIKVANAVFKVYDSKANAQKNDGITGYIGTFTTDANGKAEMELPLNKTFYARETTTPTGYVPDASKIWEIAMTSSADTATNVSLTNKEYTSGPISITKKDSQLGTVLTGAEFTLYEWSASMKNYGAVGTLVDDGDGTYSLKGYTPRATGTYYTTNCVIYTQDNLGKFKIVETKNPTNYTGTWEQEFVLDSNGKTFVYTDVKNTTFQSGKVSVIKTDSIFGKKLTGATFALLEWSKAANNYKEVGTLTDNKDGTYTVTGYTPRATGVAVSNSCLYYTQDNLGKFKIEEKTNPTGFTGSWSKEFTLGSSGEVFTFTDAQNTPYKSGTVRVTKTDQNLGYKLAGAEFTLYEWSKTSSNYAVVGTLTDNGDGTYTLKGYTPRLTGTYYTTTSLIYTQDNVGKFKLVETKNPTSYSGTWEQAFVLDSSGKTFIYDNVTNYSYASGAVTVKKTDSVLGNPLKGAEFTLYEWSKSSGNYAAVGTLTDNGDGTYTLKGYTPRLKGAYHTTTKLYYTYDNLGKFKLVETKNPTNYTGSWSQEFVLKSAGQTFIYNVKNDPKLVKLTLIKRIKVNDINWGNGNPTFIFEVTGKDVQGTTHTYHELVSFTQSYVTANTDTSGYTSISVTFEDMIAGTYTASEEIVMRYEFENISGVKNGTVKGETVEFNLVNNDNGSAIFTNVKKEHGSFTGNCHIVNEFK